MLTALMQISRMFFSQKVVSAFSPALMKIVNVLEEENGTHFFRENENEKSADSAPKKNSKQAPVDASVVH